MSHPHQFNREVCEMLAVATNPAPPPLPTAEALATLAHELRDPLTAILLALELHSGEGDPAVRRTLTMAAHQARQVVRLVDDLFDLCAASRDSLPLWKEEVDLAEVVAAARDTTTHLLAARGRRLTVALPAERVVLVVDPVRLEQVLTNLLANAAKFTDPGGDIRLTAAVEAGRIVLRVRDNGRGIAPDLLPRVFDAFWQAAEAGKSVACIGLIGRRIDRHVEPNRCPLISTRRTRPFRGLLFQVSVAADGNGS